MSIFSGSHPVDPILNSSTAVVYDRSLSQSGYYTHVNDGSGDENNSGNFQASWQGVVENTKVGVSDVSRSDLYEVDSLSKGTADATYVGYFDMHADGTLSFTAASGVVAPAAPTSVTAMVTNSAVMLTWNPSTGATNYYVKRGLTDSGTFTAIASDVTTTNYTDSTVVKGTTYYYVVSAIASGLESANSSPVSAMVPLDPPVPQTLTAGTNNLISFSSEVGVTYVLLSTNAAGLSAPLAQWPQVPGASLAGTGSALSFPMVPGQSNAFFSIKGSRP